MAIILGPPAAPPALHSSADRAMGQCTVLMRRGGGLTTADAALVTPYLLGTTTPYPAPLYSGPDATTPLVFPVATGADGVVTLWADAPARLDLAVSHPTLGADRVVLDLVLPPGTGGGGGGADVTITTNASLTVTESPADTFALAVRLSPDAGNALALRPTGLYGTDTGTGGGTGAVDSVNGYTGVVVLAASDVGALTQAAGDTRYLQSATAATTYLSLTGGSVMTGLLGPTTTNTRDLGTTALRWRKLWAVDADFTNAPVVGGSPLQTQTAGDARYSLTSHTHPQVTTGEFSFQTNPAMTDPGNGNFRSNTGAAATATALAMDQQGAGGTDITTLFNAIRLGDTIFVQDKNDALQWVRYQLTAAPTINAGWAQVPVSVISSGGTIAGTQLCVMQLTLTAGGGGGGGGMDAEGVMDLLGTTGLVEGAGIDLVYNDAAGTLTITADKTEMSFVPGDVGLGNVTNVAQAPATRLLSGTAPVRIDGGASGNLTADRTISVTTFSGTTPGVVPDGTAAGATAYLNGDGAWTIPAPSAGGARLTQIFTVPGPLAPAVGTSEFLVTLPGDIVNVWASLTAVGSGASVLVDVNLNGTTIFTTQGNRPTIAAGSQRDTTGTPDAAAADFVAGDRITVDVDQVGTHAASVQLTIGVEYTYD